MSFPAYPEYKDSGVPWLGQVPESWDLVRFKNLLRERDQRSTDGSEELLSVSAYTGVRPKSESTADGEFASRAESLEGYKVCKQTDLVMNIMLAWNRGLGVTQFDGIVSPAYCVFALGEELRPAFFDYAVRANEYTGYFKAHSSGVIDSRLRLYPDKFGALSFAKPPLEEQEAIAAFLDRETAKIDELVAEQERLIALLKEKRQAVISHAVTNGLDPNAPMKDSCIEWLGEIPAHWDATAIKRMISVATSGPRGWSELTAEDGSFFFQSQNIGRNMEADLSEGKRIEVPVGPDAERAMLQNDDVVVCITGGRTGAVAHVRYLDEAAYINQHVCLVRPKTDQVLGRYLAYALFGTQGQEQLRVAMYGLKQGLNLENVCEVLLPMPPTGDQSRIVEYLDHHSDLVSNLQHQAEAAISLLQERRAALISAAVTGKIDVRGLVEQHEMEAA